MMAMKKFLAAALIFLVPAAAGAMPLQEAVRIALENNPALQQTERSIALAEESLKVAKAGKGVSVTASGSGNASKTEGSDTSESLSARVRGSLPIYSGNKLESQIESAELGIDVAKLNFLQAQDDLVYRVVTAYIDALENYATTQVDLQTETNLADHERNIAALYDAGATARIDLLRAQVETSNAQQTTAKSHAAYEVSLTNLATLLSLEGIATLTVENVATALELGDIETYLALADERRADLRADALKLSQGELDIEIARANKRPTISAEVGAGLGAQSSRWHITPDISGGVSATWNIFDGGITRAQIQQAEIELEQLKLALQSDTDTVHEDVITAYKNLKIAVMRLRTTQRAVQLAEEERYIATERYRAGEGILLDILDAEVALTTARKNNVSATYDVARYRFALAHAIGDTLSVLN